LTRALRVAVVWVIRDAPLKGCCAFSAVAVDRAARRILAEQLAGDRFLAGHGQDLELAAARTGVPRDGGELACLLPGTPRSSNIARMPVVEHATV
jgi:hypothetical protein